MEKSICQQSVAGISFERPKDAKKIDLVQAKPIYIATDLEPNKE